MDEDQMPPQLQALLSENYPRYLALVQSADQQFTELVRANVQPSAVVINDQAHAVLKRQIVKTLLDSGASKDAIQNGLRYYRDTPLGSMYVNGIKLPVQIRESVPGGRDLSVVADRWLNGVQIGPQQYVLDQVQEANAIRCQKKMIPLGADGRTVYVEHQEEGQTPAAPPTGFDWVRDDEAPAVRESLLDSAARFPDSTIDPMMGQTMTMRVQDPDRLVCLLIRPDNMMQVLYQQRDGEDEAAFARRVESSIGALGGWKHPIMTRQNAARTAPVAMTTWDHAALLTEEKTKSYDLGAGTEELHLRTEDGPELVRLDEQ